MMDLKDIKAIVDLMKKNAITEFEMEDQGAKIKLKRGLGTVVASSDEPMGYVPVAPAAGVVPLASAPTTASATPPVQEYIDIKSPMIGTFYRASSHDAPDFVQVGTEVSPNTVVCVIEAMKIMNEIKAEIKGVVTQILVENGKPVEFGQPLFRIRPS
jgi:acetyl-CoA carboxylase biotin carboxyl carrier protein